VGACTCVFLSVIRYNNNPLHLQRVRRSDKNRKKEVKKERMKERRKERKKESCSIYRYAELVAADIEFRELLQHKSEIITNRHHHNKYRLNVAISVAITLALVGNK